MKLKELNLKGKICFIRVDMNVSIINNNIVDNTRITRALKTINYILQSEAYIILATHLGRPNIGNFSDYSVKIITQHLSNLLNINIPLISDLQPSFENSNIVMIENVRCNLGEVENSLELAKQYSNMCDLFVFDAFAIAHRIESSTYGIATIMQNKCFGLSFLEEIHYLNKVVFDDKRPFTAMLGGAKISTKLPVIQGLIPTIDNLLIVGGLLNNFLLAKGFNIGKSLCEPELLNETVSLMTELEKNNIKIIFPTHVIVTKKIGDFNIVCKKVDCLDNDDIIVDLPIDFINSLLDILNISKKVFLNGSIGLFEFDSYSNGTKYFFRSYRL